MEFVTAWSLTEFRQFYFLVPHDLNVQWLETDGALLELHSVETFFRALSLGFFHFDFFEVGVP